MGISFDLSFYPANAQAYPDALRRAPSTGTAGLQRVGAAKAMTPVQKAATERGGQAFSPPRRENRQKRPRRNVPPGVYSPYSLSFDDVMARYHRS